MVVVVSFPRTTVRLPVLIALHGRGEALKGVDRGARGWLDDYAIGKTQRRLQQPPLTRKDFEGFIGRRRLAAINTSLGERAFAGMVMVYPYTPDITAPDQRGLDDAKPFGRFLIEQLLPRVYRETPAIGTAASTGIDGVSLGGRAALLVGLEHPTKIGALGTLQAAVYPHERKTLTVRGRAAKKANPALRLRLLTSSGDFYRPAIGGLSKAWKKAGVDHQHIVVDGPHSYGFNRGPGGYEMLLFHDRALRGLPTL